MTRIEVRSKLRRILTEMLLSDLESDQEIPQAISDYILENYGWTTKEKENLKGSVPNFVKKLQKWVESGIPPLDGFGGKTEEHDYGLEAGFEKFLEAEREYLEVTLELARLLEEIVKHKDNYSVYFKRKCRAQESHMDVLKGKCQFLKVQFLLKLYGEETALSGHLALQMKLKEELEQVRKNYNELVESNKQFDEIKNDKNFCDLFKIYKELRKIEKRSEIMGEL